VTAVESHSVRALAVPLRAGFLSFVLFGAAFGAPAAVLFVAPLVDLSKSSASLAARVVFSQLNSERPKWP
jgi:hypothetical protein